MPPRSRVLCSPLSCSPLSHLRALRLKGVVLSLSSPQGPPPQGCCAVRLLPALRGPCHGSPGHQQAHAPCNTGGHRQGASGPCTAAADNAAQLAAEQAPMCNGPATVRHQLGGEALGTLGSIFRYFIFPYRYVGSILYGRLRLLELNLIVHDTPMIMACFFFAVSKRLV